MGTHPPFGLEALGRETWAHQLGEIRWCVFPLSGHLAVYRNISVPCELSQVHLYAVPLLNQSLDFSKGDLQVVFTGSSPGISFFHFSPCSPKESFSMLEFFAQFLSDVLLQLLSVRCICTEVCQGILESFHFLL